MRVLLGLIIVIVAIALSLYVGVWLMFFGGIFSVLDGIKADPIDQGAIFRGIIKILFAKVVAIITFFVIALLAPPLVTRR